MAITVTGTMAKYNIDEQQYLIASTAYGTCPTAAGTTQKDVTLLDSAPFTLMTGVTIHVKFTYNNTASNPTLKVGSSAAKAIMRYGTTAIGTSNGSTSWRPGAVVSFTYDGTNWVMDWQENSTYYYTSIYVLTNAATAAKVGASSGHTLDAGKHFQVWIGNANTAKQALTLNIDSTGAKPIYINGMPTSSTNYTLPKGMYIVYYDGTNYYFSTEGNFFGNDFICPDGDIRLVANANGDGSLLTLSDTALTYYMDDNFLNLGEEDYPWGTTYTRELEFYKWEAGYGGTLKAPNTLGAARTWTLPDASGTIALTSHTHGNLSSDGKITTAITIANNDYIIVGDNSDGGKIGKGPVFDGSTETKCLTQKGTWVSFNNYSHPTGAGNNHLPSGGSSGQWLKWNTNSAGQWASLPVATTSAQGIMQVGSGLSVSSGTVSVATTTGTSTLAWNSEVTLGTVGGLAIKAKLPANPNTNTDTLVKQTAKTDSVNYKILTTTSASPTSGNAAEAAYCANIYANASTASISSIRHTWNVSGTDKAYTAYNSTDDSIDFVFV